MLKKFMLLSLLISKMTIAAPQESFSTEIDHLAWALNEATSLHESLEKQQSALKALNAIDKKSAQEQKNKLMGEQSENLIRLIKEGRRADVTRPSPNSFFCDKIGFSDRSIPVSDLARKTPFAKIFSDRAILHPLDVALMDFKNYRVSHRVLPFSLTLSPLFAAMFLPVVLVPIDALALVPQAFYAPRVIYLHKKYSDAVRVILLLAYVTTSEKEFTVPGFFTDSEGNTIPGKTYTREVLHALFTDEVKRLQNKCELAGASCSEEQVKEALVQYGESLRSKKLSADSFESELVALLTASK